MLSTATTLEVQVSNDDNKYEMQKVGILTVSCWFKLAFILANFNALANIIENMNTKCQDIFRKGKNSAYDHFRWVFLLIFDLKKKKKCAMDITGG